MLTVKDQEGACNDEQDEEQYQEDGATSDFANAVSVPTILSVASTDCCYWVVIRQSLAFAAGGY